MSVKASVASMALSGCPEAGALRCRPELANRNLDAPQLQKFEEIVERAEEPSLVQREAQLPEFVVWSHSEDSVRTVTQSRRGVHREYTRLMKKFKPAEPNPEAISDSTTPRFWGEVVSKANDHNSRDYIRWVRQVGTTPSSVKMSLHDDSEPLNKKLNGKECRVQPGEKDSADSATLTEKMWDALEGEVLAMGVVENTTKQASGLNTCKQCYIAVKNDGVTTAYQFDNEGTVCIVRKVGYVVAENNVGKFVAL